MHVWLEYGPYLAILMGLGVFLLLKVGERMVRSATTPKTMSEWYPELERAYLAIVHKNRELLEVVAEAERVRKSLPDEYKVALDQVLMLARLVEHATFEQAMAQGVVPRYWFGGPGGDQPVLDEAPVPKDETKAETVGNVVSIQAIKKAAVDTHEWIAGQLVND